MVVYPNKKESKKKPALTAIEVLGLEPGGEERCGVRPVEERRGGEGRLQQARPAQKDPLTRGPAATKFIPSHDR